MSAVPTLRRSGRLQELDALRGIAALAVVLYHFSTRFGELYPAGLQTGLALPQGHFGVNLFFIISGFVIFMTLERTRTAGDFLVSRFSRLYPAYWVSLAITFAVTHALGLPGKLVPGSTALANLPMFHGLFQVLFRGQFQVTHVDGVYWTLEVELLFYGWMLLLFVLRKLDGLFAAVAGLLLLRCVYVVAHARYGLDLPYIAWRLLILEHLPWFALGLCTHAWLAADPEGKRHRRAAGLALAAVASLWVGPTPERAVLALAFAGLAFAAASGRLPVLQRPVLVWLGSISYPLYLLHENIGWSLLLRMTEWGWSPWLAHGLNLAAVLALSHGVSRAVEQPAMRWIRARWKARTGPPAAA